MSTILSDAMYFIRSYISGISTMPAENCVPGKRRKSLHITDTAERFSVPLSSQWKSCTNGKSMSPHVAPVLIETRLVGLCNWLSLKAFHIPNSKKKKIHSNHGTTSCWIDNQAVRLFLMEALWPWHEPRRASSFHVIYGKSWFVNNPQSSNRVKLCGLAEHETSLSAISGQSIKKH